MDHVDNDAREFGQHLKQGGWRLGLLVARNVKPGKAGRRPKADDNPSPEMDFDGKVSQTAFADEAGVAQSHVTYYYTAWQLAAEAGKCLPAEQLSPGEEDASLEDIDQDDEESRELWLTFYRKARGSNAPGGQHGSRRGKRTPVELVGDDSEQLSKHLSKVMDNVDADTDLAALVEDLRATRHRLEKQCLLIDEFLDRLGCGDVEEEEDSGHAEPDAGSPPADERPDSGVDPGHA